MPAYDVFHAAVKEGLIKDGWTITDEPLYVEFGGMDMYVDLAAEKLIAAEKGEERIAVEIKSFVGGGRPMDRVIDYGELIQEIVREYGNCKPSYGDVEVETIIDPLQGHYQLMTIGWNGQRRIHGCLLHVDIKNGKIWIQHDGTEEGIANRLVAAGVPKDEIVLAFHSPFKRRFTDFAVE